MNSSLGKHDRSNDDDYQYDTDFPSDSEDFSLPRNFQPSGYVDIDNLEQTNMDIHLPETNIGYRLLLKMGWSAGQGLGSELQGRTDPIRIDRKLDSLGIGKAEEEMEYHVTSTAQRRALDSEKQLEETEKERLEREMNALKKEEVKNDIKETLRAFYCELCDKQYSKISEYEQHLQSYDHHHKKRFKDMRESSKSTEGAIAERELRRERERKREEKELRRIQEAMMKKSGIQPNAIPKKHDTPTGVTQIASGAAIHDKTTTTNQSSGGGWSSVADTVMTSSANRAGIPGGWSVVPSSTEEKTDTRSTSNHNLSTSSTNELALSPPIGKPEQEPKLFSSKITKPPQKMSFGMSKKIGFKFDMKK